MIHDKDEELTLQLAVSVSLPKDASVDIMKI